MDAEAVCVMVGMVWVLSTVLAYKIGYATGHVDADREQELLESYEGDEE